MISSAEISARRPWGFVRVPWLFFGFFVFYLAFTNAGYFDVSDAEERFLAMKAMLETGSPLISRYWQPDPYAPIYTLGPAISALPFFGLAEIIDRFQWTSMPLTQLQVRMVLVGTAFYTALWMVLVARLAQLFTPSRRRATAIALLTGLVTLVFPYSKSFQSENLVGLLITACVYCAFRLGRSGDHRWALLAGLALGGSISCKIETALGAVPLGIFVMAARMQGSRLAFGKLTRDSLLLVLGALPGIAVVLWYNWIRYGALYDSGYGPQKFSHGFLSGMYLQWISAGKGLLWYSPILIIGFYYIPKFWRHFPREVWLPTSWWAIMTVLYAHWHSPVGETSLGARFMVSYIPFGVLPLVMMQWSDMARAARWLLGGVVMISGWLSLLFAIVPFPIYHSRRWNGAPDEPVERYRRVAENWYNPDWSPILHYQKLVWEGILDLWGVRYGPGEQILVIQPLWWILIGGGITLLLLARWKSQVMDGVRSAGSKAFRVVMTCLPLIAGIILALGKVSYPESSTLQVTWHRPGWATHTSLARAINYDPTLEDRAFFVLFYQDMSAEWRGKIGIPSKGFYRFQLESQRSTKLEIDGKLVAELPNVPGEFAGTRTTWKSVWLEPGWHTIRVQYHQNEMLGTLHVRWRPPWSAGYESLLTAELAPP